LERDVSSLALRLYPWEVQFTTVIETVMKTPLREGRCFRMLPQK